MNLNDLTSENDIKIELIKKYMYLAERYASRIKTNLDKEDALQISYLYLIKSINTYLNGNIKTSPYRYIVGHLERDMSNAIKKEEKKEKEYQSQKKINDLENNYNNELSYIELIDFIEKNDSFTTKEKKLYYQLILGYKKIEIASNLNISRSRISEILHDNRVTKTEIKTGIIKEKNREKIKKFCETK